MLLYFDCKWTLFYHIWKEFQFLSSWTWCAEHVYSLLHWSKENIKQRKLAGVGSSKSGTSKFLQTYFWKKIYTSHQCYVKSPSENVLRKLVSCSTQVNIEFYYYCKHANKVHVKSFLNICSVCFKMKRESREFHMQNALWKWYKLYRTNYIYILWNYI